MSTDVAGQCFLGGTKREHVWLEAVLKQVRESVLYIIERRLHPGRRGHKFLAQFHIESQFHLSFSACRRRHAFAAYAVDGHRAIPKSELAYESATRRAVRPSSFIGPMLSQSRGPALALQSFLEVRHPHLGLSLVPLKHELFR
jgi:hypothetical protein